MSLLDDGPAEDIAQQIAGIASVAHGIEGRLLHIIKEAAQERVHFEDFVTQLWLLVNELGQCFRQAVDLKERRDIGFETLRAVHLVELHGIWLYRKICLEYAFFRKLHSERRLRSMLSAEAFEVYQELLAAEEQEKEFLGKGDVEIRRQLLVGICTLSTFPPISPS